MSEVPRTILFVPNRKWTDQQLRDAIASSGSYRTVLEKLGLRRIGGREYRRIQKRVTELGLDASHLVGREPGTRRTLWTDDELRAALAASRSLAEAIRRLRIVGAGGNYKQVKRRIAELGLDTSHMLGKGWNVGLSFRPRRTATLDALLVAGRWTSSHRLKQRLIAAGIKDAACELCGWARRSADGRIPLELDHINGDHEDNRLENLRILCPNCHSLQPTHRGSNQKRRARVV